MTTGRILRSPLCKKQKVYPYIFHILPLKEGPQRPEAVMCLDPTQILNSMGT